MRVCLVTETFPPEINGVALTVQRLLDGLREQGHEAMLVRPAQAGERPGRESTADGSIELRVPGAALPRYPGLRFGFPVTRRLKALWREQRPDVVYIATEGPLGWAAVRAARALGIPSTSGFHTRFDDYFGHYGLRFMSALVFAYLRRFHNFTRATLVPTQELARDLAGRGFRGVRLLKRAVDTRQFDPARRDLALRARWGLGDRDLAVIYVGRIAPEKNLEVAVAAFRAIEAVRPGARFVWVGDGPARAALQRAHPDFIFCGLQRGAELGRHYASADLFLFPSLSETFGNVTLEALASGLAVLAFDYGAAAEHIVSGSNGLTVPREQAAAFVAAARELAADPIRIEHLRRRARESVAELNPASVSRHFAALLQDCCRGSPA